MCRPASVALLLLVPAWGLSLGCSEFVPRSEPDAGPDVQTPIDTGGDLCAGQICDDDDPCTKDTCNASTGECEYEPRPNGSTCDDGDFCTVDGICSVAGCVGEARTCPSPFPECQPGVCDSVAGECVLQLRSQGSDCDDGDPCTVLDVCDGVVCQGAPLECPEPPDQCLTAACSPDTGECGTSAVADGGSCDDGDACSVGDTCVGGACSAGGPLDCPEATQPCTVSSCDPAVGCVSGLAPDGASCSDDDLCTIDSCVGGNCIGDALDCSSLNTPCATGKCSPDSGACQAKPLSDGTTCNDGDACTLLDSCDGEGLCIGGVAKDCAGLDGTCVLGACDPDSGDCTTVPGPPGVPCDDDNKCTEDDACLNGSCSGGLALDCTGSAGPCQVGVCDSDTGKCTGKTDPAADFQPCEDGDFCTVDAVCVEGTCAGVPRDCSDAAGECQVGKCDESLDACIPSGVPDGAECDDGLVCTLTDSCIGGICSGADPMDCSDLDTPCQAGFCSEQAGGCTPVLAEKGTPCDDGLACTGLDGCDEGVCGGEELQCGELSTDCLSGTCTEAAGGCTTVAVPDGSTCSDGLDCTIDDACNQGQCASGVPVDCPCPSPSAALSLVAGCVEVAGAPFIDATTGFTVEFWIRTASTTSARVMDQRITEAKGESDWSITYEVPGGKGQLRFHYGNVTGADSQIGMTGVNLNDGDWHHVALTRDNTTIRWWIDGAGSFGNLATNTKQLSNDSPLRIGCSTFGDGEHFDGQIDEVRFSTFARYAQNFDPPGRHARDVATIALWHLDEPPGSVTVHDVGGAGHDGALVGDIELVQTGLAGPLSSCCGDGLLAPGEECEGDGDSLPPGCTESCLLEAGPPARAMELDGQTGCIRVEGASLLTTVANVTVELWVRTDATEPARLLDKRLSEDPGQTAWSVLVESDGSLSLVVGNESGGESKFTSTTSINDGQWHHVAFIFSASNVVRWYRDGVPGPTGKLETAKPLGNAADLFIGCAGEFAANPEPLNGAIDGVRISDTLRYTTPFLPPVAPTPENATRLLLTFDQPLLGGVVPDTSADLQPAFVVGGATQTEDVP